MDNGRFSFSIKRKKNTTCNIRFSNIQLINERGWDGWLKKLIDPCMWWARLKLPAIITNLKTLSPVKGYWIREILNRAQMNEWFDDRDGPSPTHHHSPSWPINLVWLKGAKRKKEREGGRRRCFDMKILTIKGIAYVSPLELIFFLMVNHENWTG